MASETPASPTAAKRSKSKTASAENVEVSDGAAGLPKLALLSFAEASVIRGTAEYLATKLTGRGHSCTHFPKYRVKDEKSPYPSRLGFIHRTDSNLSYLDTSKLCAKCCADVVPDGYNAWSIFTDNSNTGEAQAGQPESGVRGRRWLDMPPSAELYPRVFQAGTEGFTDVSSRKRSKFVKGTATVITKSIAADPVTIPIPLVVGAKEAWQWLEAQGKPFCIDQLHLTKKWSPLAEKNAAMDAAISANTASVINPKKSATAREPKKTITEARKSTLKDCKASSLEIVTENQPSAAAEQKILKTEEVVTSPVEMEAENPLLTKDLLPSSDDIQTTSSIKLEPSKTRNDSAKKETGGIQPISMREGPELQLQSIPRALDNKTPSTPKVFELEAAPVTAPALSSTAMAARGWTNNRSRYTPIPLGSPAELPTYPDYMQPAQNRGSQPQSTLRIFLTEQNLIPSDSKTFGPGLYRVQSLTTGSEAVSQNPKEEPEEEEYEEEEYEEEEYQEGEYEEEEYEEEEPEEEEPEEEPEDDD